MNIFKRLALLSGLLLSTQAWADTRASVNRTSIRADENVQLVVETDGRQAPDESLFNKDFVITARSTGRSLSYAGGNMRMSTRYEYELSPRRAGRIIIPPIRIGNDTTSALVVDVLNAVSGSGAGRSPNSAAASNTEDVFIRTTLETMQPYVQQGSLLTVRYYIGRSLIDAALDQPSAEGVTLTQVASDVQTSEIVNGRNFQVVTRRYWVVPDTAGRVRITGARLVGTTAGGFFDETFGDGIERVNAVGDTLELIVQPQPAAAAEPWLPLNDLRLRYTQVPDSEISASKPGRVTVEMVADGAMPADLPQLNLQADNAAQVYPEPATSKTELRNGQLVTTVTRAFSVLPTQGGEITLRMPAVPWWNIAAQRNESALLKAQRLHASGPAAASATASGPTGNATGANTASVAIFKRMWPAVVMTLGVLALGWVWAQRLRKGGSRPGDAVAPLAGREGALKAAPAVAAQPAPPSLDAALASGDLRRISAALCSQSRPPTGSLETVRGQLSNTRQQAAVARLQAALWGGADAAEALAALQSAFATPPEWVSESEKKGDAGLPPLYPT